LERLITQKEESKKEEESKVKVEQAKETGLWYPVITVGDRKQLAGVTAIIPDDNKKKKSGMRVVSPGKITLDSQKKIIAFSTIKGDAVWEVRINDKQIFPAKYRTVDLNDRLIILENGDGEWATADINGKILTEWIKATYIHTSISP